MKKILVVIVALLVVVGSFLGFYQYSLSPVSKSEELIAVTIEEGSSNKTIISELKESGLIRSKFFTELYLRFDSGHLKAGTYQFSKNMSVSELVEALKKGPTSFPTQFSITIPEGKNLEQIAEAFSEKTVYTKEEIISFLDSNDYVSKAIQNYWFVTEEVLDKQIRHPLEGYLFPDTYTYTANNLPLDAYFNYLLDTAELRLNTIKDQIEQAPMNLTIHEVMTLSSIVQAEGLYSHDLPKIAQVFYNRLEIGMKLETDPTVAYSLNVHLSQVLYEHLKVDSPYNTYMYPGLPVGPINSPGLAAIEATLNPIAHDYFFFFSKEDGETIFTKTFEEHQRVAEENKWSTWQ